MERFPLDLALLNVDPPLLRKVLESVELIKECLTRWKPAEVGFSFNGGKDSVVLAALVLHVATQLELEKHATVQEEGCRVGDIRTIFFLTEKEWPQMLNFMRNFAATFRLRVIELTCGIKEGLAQLVHTEVGSDNIPIQAMFMGTRRDDPHGKFLTGFSPTDPSWPALMRVNPILEFHYHDIWSFIRIFNLPYCQLYDQGFTSIGATDDTTTNESLWNHTLRHYAKPWMLPNGQHERLGRGCRRFLQQRGFPSLLAYPSYALAEITKYISFPDLTNLYLCGNSSLNRVLTQQPGVTYLTVRINFPNPIYFKLLPTFRHIKQLRISIASRFATAVHLLDGIFDSLITNLPPNLQAFEFTFLSFSKPSFSRDHKLVSWLRSTLSSSLHTLAFLVNTPVTSLHVPPSTRHLKLIWYKVPDEVFNSGIELKTLQTASLPFHSDLTLLEKFYRTLKTLVVTGSRNLDGVSLEESYLKISPLLSTSALSSLTLLCTTGETILHHLPPALTHLKARINSISRPFSLPPSLRTVELNITSINMANSNFKDGEKRNELIDVQHTSKTLFPQFCLSALPSGIRRIDITVLVSRFLPPTPDTWPARLEHIDMNLHLNSPLVLKTIPNSLTSLSIGSNDMFDKHWSEIMSYIPGVKHLTLNSLPANPAEVKLLPKALKSLVIGTDTDPKELGDRCAEEGEFISNVIQSLPASLISLTLPYLNAKPLIPWLPPNLETLVLTKDTTVDSSSIPLLPRSLTRMTLQENSSQYGLELELLPPRMMKLEAPKALLTLSRSEFCNVCPPGLVTVIFSNRH